MRTTRAFALPSQYRRSFQRVAPGVFTIPGQSLGRVYVIEANDGLTLVDTGHAWRSRNLLEMIERAGRRVREVRRVLLTHVHSGHVGGLRSLQANADVEVITMASNACALRGQIRTVADGDTVDDVCGLHVIATPGHCAGHACFWLPDRGVLFAGDTLSSLGGLAVLPSALHHDIAQVERDVTRCDAIVAVGPGCRVLWSRTTGHSRCGRVLT